MRILWDFRNALKVPCQNTAFHSLILLGRGRQSVICTYLDKQRYKRRRDFLELKELKIHWYNMRYRDGKSPRITPRLIWLPPITIRVNHMTNNYNVTRIWIHLEVVGSVVLCCSRISVRKKRRLSTRSPPCAQIVFCSYTHTCNSHMLDRWAQCRALGWQIVSASALDFYSLCYQ